MGLDPALLGVSVPVTAADLGWRPNPDLGIGVVLPNTGGGSSPETLDAGAETAERLGWFRVWVTDHLMVPAGPEAAEYGYALEALVALTYVAARHRTVRVGTSVVVPAMRDAPILAKQLASIDVLSGGRLTVGVGVSDKDDLPEYANLGKAERFTRRGAYLDETVALWRHLWSGRTDPFRGEFHVLTDYVFDPLPVQSGRVPVLCGGRSDRALARTAALADGYHAAQTGPDDLAARLPRLAELTRAAGRPLPSLSVRARVKRDPIAVWSLHGSAESMVQELLRFAKLGTDEVALVFDDRTPGGLAAAMERFDTAVVRPFRDRAAAAEPSSGPAGPAGPAG